MGKQTVQLKETNKVGECIVKLPKAAADALIDPKHGITKAIAYSQNFLRNWINEEGGLLRNCVRVDVI